MKKALFISYSFPPSTHSNAKRPGMVVQRLLSEGWKVDVISSYYGMPPAQEEWLSHAQLTITRVEDELYRLIKILGNIRVVATSVDRGCSLVFWPDKRVLWIRKVCKILKNKDHYDLVVVSVVPASALCFAKWYAQFDHRWIIDYQEPVIPELMERTSHLLLQRLWFKKLWQLEETALKKCGKAIFSCESCRDAYVQCGLLNVQKTEVVSHSYNPESYAVDVSVPDDQFHIVYTGTFHGRNHGDRSPEPFLCAFKQFLDTHPEAHDDARFVIYGTWLPEHDHLVHELRLEQFIDIRQPVYGADYFKILQTSPVLLLVTSAQHNLHVPGKLTDYLGAGRPILAFVQKESESLRILHECRLDEFYCSSDDRDQGAAVIADMWNRYKNKNLAVVPDRVARWSVERQMDRLMRVINDLNS